MNLLYEMNKDRGTTVLIPTDMATSLGAVVALTQGAQRAPMSLGRLPAAPRPRSTSGSRYFPPRPPPCAAAPAACATRAVVRAARRVRLGCFRRRSRDIRRGYTRRTPPFRCCRAPCARRNCSRAPRRRCAAAPRVRARSAAPPPPPRWRSRAPAPAGASANRKAVPRPSGRSCSPTWPRNFSLPISRTAHMPTPFAPQNAMSSASSAATCAAVPHAAEHDREHAGVRLQRLQTRQGRRHQTGCKSSRPVRTVQVGFTPVSGCALGEGRGGALAACYRASGRYLMRWGSVASAPRRRRLSSS